jgi:hypothetical protein
MGIVFYGPSHLHAVRDPLPCGLFDSLVSLHPPSPERVSVAHTHTHTHTGRVTVCSTCAHPYTRKHRNVSVSMSGYTTAHVQPSAFLASVPPTSPPCSPPCPLLFLLLLLPSSFCLSHTYDHAQSDVTWMHTFSSTFWWTSFSAWTSSW